MDPVSGSNQTSRADRVSPNVPARLSLQGAEAGGTSAVLIAESRQAVADFARVAPNVQPVQILGSGGTETSVAIVEDEIAPVQTRGSAQYDVHTGRLLREHRLDPGQFERAGMPSVPPPVYSTEIGPDFDRTSMASPRDSWNSLFYPTSSGSTPPLIGATGQQAMRQIAVASLTQAISTGFSFGLKPFVEAAFDQALTAGGFDNTMVGSTDMAKLASNIAGGVFVGLVHNAVSASVGSYALAQLEGERYTDTSTSALTRELNEVASVTVPVIAAFTATYSGGGAIASQVPEAIRDNIWASAAARSVQSIAGGLIQGAVTDAVRQAMPAYKAEHTQPIEASEVLKNFRDSFSNTFTGADKGAMWKHGIGKVLGSTFGMVATTYAAPAAANAVHASTGLPGPAGANAIAQVAGNATGMVSYLGSWFTGVHAGSLIHEATNETGSTQSPASTFSQQTPDQLA